MTPEIIVDSPDMLARWFTAFFEAESRAAIAARGRFSCAVPGGSVAERLLPRLVYARVAWSAVEIFWVDERAVGPDDPDSNYGVAQRLLLGPLGAHLRAVHRMATEGADLEAMAQAYEDEMLRHLGDPPCLDLVVLGVGTDGHVCSLFPGHALLREPRRCVAAVFDSPKPPPRRITFTMRPLAEARTMIVAAFGGSKANAIREGLCDSDSQIPIALALRRARRALVLLDPEAADALHADG